MVDAVVEETRRVVETRWAAHVDVVVDVQLEEPTRRDGGRRIDAVDGERHPRLGPRQADGVPLEVVTDDAR